MTVLEQLFSDYYMDIYRYMYSLCRDVELVEDLTSDEDSKDNYSLELFPRSDIRSDDLIEIVKQNHQKTFP